MANLQSPGIGGFLRMTLPVLAAWATALPAQEDATPDVPIIAVSPQVGSSDSLIPDWEQQRRPATLGSRDRQAILEYVSGGGEGGVPLINTIQTQGRTPTVRHLILTVKRPWYVHRAFLAAEGVQRVDARSTMHFEGATPGRVIVGLNLIEGNVYLLDFLLKGEGKGDYTVITGAGAQAFPDVDGDRTHVLLALEAQSSGWTEVSLSRDGGAFDLHSVEVTLARGPGEEGQGR